MERHHEYLTHGLWLAVSVPYLKSRLVIVPQGQPCLANLRDPYLRAILMRSAILCTTLVLIET
jgi:hypothetical protein